jgi:glucose/arabinose dehydrogenase
MARSRRRRWAAVLVTALVLAGVAAGADDPVPAGADPDLDGVTVGLAPVTTALTRPVALTWRPGDDRMYVAEQAGTLRIVDTATGTVVGTALTLTGITNTGERGLLGVAFSGDGTKLYVDYTDAAGAVTVAEYTMAGDVAVTSSARVLLSIPHPRTNHNGGQLALGPDGMLFIGTGDGGGGGDPDLNGQDKGTLLGKILRIDPAPSATLPYTIPADNPFVGQPGVRGEIWMYGLRNPWRFSFDRLTGDMWIADVGQGLYEEVDFAPAGDGGANWGWNLREGFHAYAGAQPPDGRDPLIEQSHSAGWCSVIGGFVYRGDDIANLGGAYVYGDLCRSVLTAAVRSGATVADQQDLSVGLSQITTFGEDHDGELYVANLAGTVSKLVGTPPRTVSIADEAMVEGDSTNRSMTFPVTLTEPATAQVTVQYTVTAVTATGGTRPGGGADVRTRSGTVTFKTGTGGKTPVVKQVTVPTFPDALTEGDETFTVTLSAPTGGYALLHATAVGTILDDDPSSGPRVGVGDAAIHQQVAGSESLSIPVSLSSKQSGPVTVRYTITPGTATHSAKKTGGGDFGGKLSGVLTFKAGTTVKQVTVPVWPDLLADADHSFSVALSDLSGAGVSLVRSTGTGRILDPTS